MFVLFRVGEELGRGQFGRVVRGTLTKEEEETEEGGQKEVLEVAIKTLKPSSDISSVVKFLREAVIMGQFSHPNVIRFYGVVTEGELVRGLRDVYKGSAGESCGSAGESCEGVGGRGGRKGE